VSHFVSTTKLCQESFSDRIHQACRRQADHENELVRRGVPQRIQDVAVAQVLAPLEKKAEHQNPMIKLAPGTFYGDVRRDCRANHLTFSESRYAGGLIIPLHAHANPFFCLVLNGESTETVADKSRINSPSTLVYHPAKEPHANEWHRSGRCFHIEIGADRWDKLTQDAPLLTRSAVFQHGPIIALARRAHNEFVDMDEFSSLVLDGLVLELLVEVSRVPGNERRIPRWLLRVREILHESFNSSLAMGDIAKAVDVHPAHLSRAFRQYFRLTPGEYVRRIRVEAAAELLAKSSFSIAEIAERTGFADQSHLTKCFLREYRITPSVYRHASSAQNGSNQR
jgi:AraC family transcriptional regulator